MLGMRMLEQMGAEENRWLEYMRGGVAVLVKMFAQEQHEISAQAIADFANKPEYSSEAVGKVLDELQASGDYDRLMAEGVAMRKGGNNVGT
jgi:hypothetical protein